MERKLNVFKHDPKNETITFQFIIEKSYPTNNPNTECF